MSKIEIGHLAESWVYPVKGMQGVKTAESSARSVSIVGDRRVAFTEVGGVASLPINLDN